MNNTKNLQKIGLTEKEARVYLAALELGPTNIQALTKKSDIKRSTAYDIIKNLETQGLMSETTKGKRRSEDYAKSMRVFYDLLWNISKPYGEMGLKNLI